MALGVNAGGRSETEVVEDGIAAVQTLVQDCGLPTRLRDIGVTEESLPAVAEAAIGDAAIFNNPRNVSQDEVLALLTAAW